MKILILLSLVAVALAQSSSTPHHCCTDHQFEVTMGQTGGTVYNEHGHLVQNWIDGYNKVHYDGYNQQIAVESHMNLPNGTEVFTTVILDFAHHREYIMKGNSCYHTPLRRKINLGCIPPTAVYLGKTYMGYGSSQVVLNNWEYHPQNTDQSLKVSVTEAGCIPFAESFVGHVTSPINGKRIETNYAYIFTGFRTGLRSPSVFHIDDACKRSNSVTMPIG